MTKISQRQRDEKARLLHESALRLLRFARRADASSGLGAAQTSVLSLLARTSPQAVRELAKAEGVAHPTMSRLVSSLESAGLVRKDSDPLDRRRQLVEILPDGIARQREAFERRQRITDMLAATLKPDTLFDLATVLATLADSLDGRREPTQ